MKARREGALRCTVPIAPSPIAPPLSASRYRSDWLTAMDVSPQLPAVFCHAPHQRSRKALTHSSRGHGSVAQLFCRDLHSADTGTSASSPAGPQWGSVVFVRSSRHQPTEIIRYLRAGLVAADRRNELPV